VCIDHSGSWLPGDQDPAQSGFPQDAARVAWFRDDDNDPFVIDPATTIDILSYTTVEARLPGNDEWGASGNLCVKEPSFCGPNPPSRISTSQAVMYSGAAFRTLFAALGADDVNMLKMARTGLNRFANDSDDYTVDLTNIGNCSLAHDVKVTMASLPGRLGVCGGWKLDYSVDPGDSTQARHFSLIRDHPLVPLFIQLNSNLTWDYSLPTVFDDGFESGNTSAWSSVVP